MFSFKSPNNFNKKMYKNISISQPRIETTQINDGQFRFRPLINKPVNKSVNKPVDFSIKKIYIYYRIFTEFCAKNFKTYFE